MTKTTSHKRAEKNTLTYGAVLLDAWFLLHTETSRSALGRKIGVSRGTINHILAGTQQPTTRTAIDLFYACGIDILEWGNAPRKLQRTR